MYNKVTEVARAQHLEDAITLYKYLKEVDLNIVKKVLEVIMKEVRMVARQKCQ